MKKQSAKKEIKFFSISVIIIGIVLIFLACFPETLFTRIAMKIVIAFLIASGISALFRLKRIK